MQQTSPPSAEAKTIHEDRTLGNVVDIVTRCGTSREACIKILQEVQEAYGYLPTAALRYVTEHTRITPRQIYGVATFYERFRFKPLGRHLIKVCRGTACHVRGAPQVLDAVEQELGLAEGKDTTADGEFTYEKIACFGACALAPVVVVDGQTKGGMTADKMRRLLRREAKSNDPAKGENQPDAKAE
jgi:NADH:ubiquinone oxidoreductase subunit E